MIILDDEASESMAIYGSLRDKSHKHELAIIETPLGTLYVACKTEPTGRLPVAIIVHGAMEVLLNEQLLNKSKPEPVAKPKPAAYKPSNPDEWMNPIQYDEEEEDEPQE